MSDDQPNPPRWLRQPWQADHDARDHLAVVEVTGHALRDLFTRQGDWWGRCSAGLPPGAEYVRGYHDPVRDVHGFVYRHPSFRETAGGSHLTRVDVQFQSWDGKPPPLPGGDG